MNTLTRRQRPPRSLINQAPSKLKQNMTARIHYPAHDHLAKATTTPTSPKHILSRDKNLSPLKKRQEMPKKSQHSRKDTAQIQRQHLHTPAALAHCWKGATLTPTRSHPGGSPRSTADNTKDTPRSTADNAEGTSRSTADIMAASETPPSTSAPIITTGSLEHRCNKCPKPPLTEATPTSQPKSPSKASTRTPPTHSPQLRREPRHSEQDCNTKRVSSRNSCNLTEKGSKSLYSQQIYWNIWYHRSNQVEEEKKAASKKLHPKRQTKLMRTQPHQKRQQEKLQTKPHHKRQHRSSSTSTSTTKINKPSTLKGRQQKIRPDTSQKQEHTLHRLTKSVTDRNGVVNALKTPCSQYKETRRHCYHHHFHTQQLATLILSQGSHHQVSFIVPPLFYSISTPPAHSLGKHTDSHTLHSLATYTSRLQIERNHRGRQKRYSCACNSDLVIRRIDRSKSKQKVVKVDNRGEHWKSGNSEYQQVPASTCKQRLEIGQKRWESGGWSFDRRQEARSRRSEAQAARSGRADCRRKETQLRHRSRRRRATVLNEEGENPAEDSTLGPRSPDAYAVTAQPQQTAAPRQPPKDSKLTKKPKIEFYYVDCLHCLTAAIWLPPEDLQECRRTRTGYNTLLTLASYCTLHASHQQPIDGCWEALFNEICVCCPPAASHKLQQNCMHLVGIRNLTHYMLLENTPNVSFQKLIKTHNVCLEICPHNTCLHNACLEIKTHNVRLHFSSHNACLIVKPYNASLDIKHHNACLHINAHNDCLYENVCLIKVKNIGACQKEHRHRLYVNQPKHFFPTSNILGGPQLNLWKGVDKGAIRSTDLNTYLRKICHSLKYCTCNIMTTSSSVVATTRKLFEQNVEPMDTITSSKKRGVSVMVVSSKKKAKGKGVKLPRAPFWLGITL